MGWEGSRSKMGQRPEPGQCLAAAAASVAARTSGSAGRSSRRPSGRDGGSARGTGSRGRRPRRGRSGELRAASPSSVAPAGLLLQRGSTSRRAPA
eukprot:4235520-Lingulodinium_polyedra.AAC.2